eukprot:4739538-Pyramimonas_sp.AAC.2
MVSSPLLTLLRYAYAVLFGGPTGTASSSTPPTCRWHHISSTALMSPSGFTGSPYLRQGAGREACDGVDIWGLGC